MDDLQQQFKKCFAPLSFLIELANDRQLSGYDVIKHLRAFGIKISHGTVYSQIHRLEHEGFIKAQQSNDTTVYTLTDKGKKQFQIFIDTWQKPIAYAYHNLCANKQSNT
jgi:DNA-binding PadR family transcriptional regulator